MIAVRAGKSQRIQILLPVQLTAAEKAAAAVISGTDTEEPRTSFGALTRLFCVPTTAPGFQMLRPCEVEERSGVVAKSPLHS
ncbi:hypothetical protein CAK95_11825 [Pseudorhodoplanes sinuspersici]|uniref:Uncharacterized protein n=1 Tax=Pseudorhodoplanes sinuspersici TaxID=1235591 RepID=A0A1W6ZQR2_9HYPH|nr:hypothetical protein CAK95_11825 [Pseudorhodoplanes sinuspersici]